MGAPMDKIEGLKWHIVAKTAGKGDLMLDEAMAQATPEERANAERAARKWLPHTGFVADERQRLVKRSSGS